MRVITRSTKCKEDYQESTGQTCRGSMLAPGSRKKLHLYNSTKPTNMTQSMSDSHRPLKVVRKTSLCKLMTIMKYSKKTPVAVIAR